MERGGAACSPSVDVVVVAYNSADHLRPCVEPLAREADLRVIVVDNHSSDGSPAAVADLPVESIELRSNRGFAYGSNRGWQAGVSPYVLFLNPDAGLDPASVRGLAAVLEREGSTGAVGPRIVNEQGGLEYSQRRFPRLRSTYAQALFLHRLFPRAAWVDEVVRDPAAYERRGSPEWISGACLLVRRALLEALGGWDERFFLYSEDKDLCKRIRDAGFHIRYEPAVTARHVGGASAPRPALLPVLAASRVRYAKKHSGRLVAALERLGIGISALTHAAFGQGGRAARAGHIRSLTVVASGRMPTNLVP